MVGRIIDTDEDVTDGVTWLVNRVPEFKNAYQDTGILPLRRQNDGFAALFSAIVGQQVSTASASAIWARVEAAGMNKRENVAAASDADLQACGLSRPKVRYARALAQHPIEYVGLRREDTETVVTELCKITGIGRWTAEVYALSSLGRADVFPSGDLALQEAAKLVFKLNERPTEKAMAKMALDWSPWRAVAARLLWAYYRVAKNREGIR